MFLASRKQAILERERVTGRRDVANRRAFNTAIRRLRGGGVEWGAVGSALKRAAQWTKWTTQWALTKFVPTADELKNQDTSKCMVDKQIDKQAASRANQLVAWLLLAETAIGVESITNAVTMPSKQTVLDSVEEGRREMYTLAIGTDVTAYRGPEPTGRKDNWDFELQVVMNNLLETIKTIENEALDTFATMELSEDDARNIQDRLEYNDSGELTSIRLTDESAMNDAVRDVFAFSEKAKAVEEEQAKLENAYSVELPVAEETEFIPIQGPNSWYNDAETGRSLHRVKVVAVDTAGRITKVEPADFEATPSSTERNPPLAALVHVDGYIENGGQGYVLEEILSAQPVGPDHRYDMALDVNTYVDDDGKGGELADYKKGFVRRMSIEELRQGDGFEFLQRVGRHHLQRALGGECIDVLHKVPACLIINELKRRGVLENSC